MKLSASNNVDGLMPFAGRLDQIPTPCSVRGADEAGIRSLRPEPSATRKDCDRCTSPVTADFLPLTARGL